ncbi:DNA cytosine methyltransferase [Mesorhizobium sp. ES1-4]|uniref:DNA cytosine methyltransferase n=1 Tax=Mesorhizobium sp. ES1-4 TaxID=2876627 RepID=UPI001CC9F614|nr:DNA cytosine methyltransferase [Mesorhizobium sp. ES1-4]MBZ9798712.1 DNA cytosine methyltransferase [Mesorhizobium sp. ES1-4]
MRVFSTFSGISAATVAWKELGWTFAGYADYDPDACAVLAARCGATTPKYHPTTDPDLMADEMYALAHRIESGHAKGAGQSRAPTRIKAPSHEKHWEMLEKERDNREHIVARRSRTTYPINGKTPNFGDIWYITDADLEELGEIDLLEGGSPCQAFSAAGSKAGLLDHRSAAMFGFIDLIERMKRINGLKWVLWENVKGVLNDDQNGFGYLLGRIATAGGAAVVPPDGRFANAGYVSGPDGDVAWRLLDAQYFGKPNRRERVYALARVGHGSAGVDPREVLFDEECEELRPEVSLRKIKATAGVPGPRAQELAGYRGPIAFMAGQSAKARSQAASTTVIPTLRSQASGTNRVPSVAYVAAADHDDGHPFNLETIDWDRLVVRELLPTECERLMGFPEGWTAVDVNGAVMTDNARYKCIGNSMSVNVMRWIGRRMTQHYKKFPL